ncbi:MAG: acyltransferase [Dysgonamonadaceae bacterium]|jgi:peptidoglycan/LPS O-acetylase OafA/YrhL|nr:acyltransferase [Dysgonamonadaceae bacterium]
MNQKNSPEHKSKPHYEILDALRGVAAILVVAFHVFESYATSSYDQILNHAYLAVDFFFMLSGFVIGYAYDDRMKKMTFAGFMKMRIMRLQPMVVFGTALGTILFYYGASAAFPLIAQTPLWKLLLFALLSVLIIPTPKSVDIRGNYPEMYNLDGPIWTLAYEYFGNILYALFVNRFTKRALIILVAVAGCSTLYLTLSQGDVCGGWFLNGSHIYKGATRLIFPFFCGLLLFRIHKLIKTRHAFIISSVILVALLVMPRIGDEQTKMMNGIYEAAVIIIAFPIIVAIGAGGKVGTKSMSKLCKFLGDISYPIYLINYPICYIQTGWVSNQRAVNPDFGLGDAGVIPIVVFLSITALSIAATYLYDKPVRKWMKEKIKKISH